jgi:murein DD-endopeptidase MepM/ murein hydrolase activator NlpD
LVVAIGLWLWLRPDVQPNVVSAEDISLTPTGLAARLAVVNAENTAQLRLFPTPISVVLPTPTINWTDSIVVVTPTPRSVQERLLFADPLVAKEGDEKERTSEGTTASIDRGAGASVAPLGGLKPLIMRAMAADENGGTEVKGPLLDKPDQPRILPALAAVLIPDRATPTPIPAPIPTEPPVVLSPGRAWASFLPAPGSDHFWVGRPFPSFVQNQIAAPSYQFGSTGGNRYRPHHGMDIANSSGTPVRAATTGEVIHAGLDDPELLGPYNRFYGNAVVIRLDRRLPIAGGELDVFLLYGHLSEVYVARGQRVQPDDIVGAVGMTGIAIGPHLHVEMRVGANTYENSVNPYLWVEPPSGNGAVAVRLLTADGRTWPRARLTLARFEGNTATWARVIEIYPDDESVNPNPTWGENGAMEAVPAGYYYLVGSVNGERVSGQAEVRPGQTTFVEIRTKQ